MRYLLAVVAVVAAGVVAGGIATEGNVKSPLTTHSCSSFYYATGSDGHRHPHPCPTKNPVGTGPQPSSCSFTNASSSACEQVPPKGSCHFRHNGTTALPDSSCTPGALNPAVSKTTVRSTICVHGYTKTIRPPVSYTSRLKAKLMQAYGLNPADAKSYELDHLVPLEGGGAPSDPANLWPQPYAPTPGAHQKDDEENFLKLEACGSKPNLLANLQAAISSDWLTAYQADNPSHQTF